jgi:hypothetical protein
VIAGISRKLSNDKIMFAPCFAWAKCALCTRPRIPNPVDISQGNPDAVHHIEKSDNIWLTLAAGMGP